MIYFDNASINCDIIRCNSRSSHTISYSFKSFLLILYMLVYTNFVLRTLTARRVARRTGEKAHMSGGNASDTPLAAAAKSSAKHPTAREDPPIALDRRRTTGSYRRAQSDPLDGTPVLSHFVRARRAPTTHHTQGTPRCCPRTEAAPRAEVQSEAPLPRELAKSTAEMLMATPLTRRTKRHLDPHLHQTDTQPGWRRHRAHFR